MWGTEPDSCCYDLVCKYRQTPSQLPRSALSYNSGDFGVPLYRGVPLLVSRSFQPLAKDIPARVKVIHARTNSRANEAPPSKHSQRTAEVGHDLCEPFSKSGEVCVLYQLLQGTKWRH